MSDNQEMTETQQDGQTADSDGSSDERTFPGAVAEVRDRRTLVINRGSRDGVREGMKVLVYKESEEEVIDPETEEPLGRLEVVKGTGKVTHVQENMATIVSVTEDPTRPSDPRSGGRQAGPGPGGRNPMQGGANPMGGGGGPGGGGMFSAMAQMMGGQGEGNPMPGGGPGGEQPSGGSEFDPFENPERGDFVRPREQRRRRP